MGLTRAKTAKVEKLRIKAHCSAFLLKYLKIFLFSEKLLKGVHSHIRSSLGVTPSSSSYNIEVNVSIIGIGCTFGESNLKWKLIVLSEKKAEEKAAIKIDGHGHAQGSTAKDSLLHQCVISHRLRTPIQNCQRDLCCRIHTDP